MGSGKKQSSCSSDSEYGAFIIGKSEQQFKIQSNFGIFDQLFRERQLYKDAESLALKCICELLGNILFLCSMKSILDLCKSLVDI